MYNIQNTVHKLEFIYYNSTLLSFFTLETVYFTFNAHLV